MAAIGFGELVGLMVWGTEAPDTCRGVIREVGEDGEHRRRVIRDGFLVRTESDDGQPQWIIGPDASWYWDIEAAVMRVRPHERDVASVYGGGPIGGLHVGGHRGSWSRWEGTDFTQPSSAVGSTSFLGRDCYTVELAPPGHKPFPLRITVDAATGLVLRSQNDGFGYVTEWVELEIGADIAAETFAWSGPAEPLPTRADRQREHELDTAHRQEWLADHGLGSITLPSRTELNLHDWDDDTGVLYASIEARQSGTLMRRPVSSEVWDAPTTAHSKHRYRWSDARWDWFLCTEEPLAPQDVEEIETQLQSAT